MNPMMTHTDTKVNVYETALHKIPKKKINVVSDVRSSKISLNAKCPAKKIEGHTTFQFEFDRVGWIIIYL
jgi:hypothetical protein